VIDQLLSRNNQTTVATKLQQITVPSGLQAGGLSAQSLAASAPTASPVDGPSAGSTAGSAVLPAPLRPQALAVAVDHLAVNSSTSGNRLPASVHASVDDDLLELLTSRGK
jgi:hypothetical protein